MKDKRNNSVRVYKRWKKRLNYYSYFLLNCNKVTSSIYSLMLFIDLTVIFLIPMETIFNMNQSQDSKSYISFNYYLISMDYNSNLFISDIINGYLVILFLMMVINFLRFDYKISTYRMLGNDTMINLYSFLFLITSKFLIYGFMVFQIIGIKCYSTGMQCSN